MSLEIRHVRMSDPHVLSLLQDLEREYTTRYGFLYESLVSYPAERFAPPDGAFMLLYEDGHAIAGGAFQRHSGNTAEIKRMWTHREHRRRGLAARVLAELEREAAGRGYTRLRLPAGGDRLVSRKRVQAVVRPGKSAVVGPFALREGARLK